MARRKAEPTVAPPTEPEQKPAIDEFYRVALSSAEVLATLAVLQVVETMVTAAQLVTDAEPGVLQSARNRIAGDVPDYTVGQARRLALVLLGELTHAGWQEDGKANDDDKVLPVRKTRRLLEQAQQGEGSAVIEYFVASRNEWTTRRVDIEDVYEMDEAWYLEGYCHLRHDHRMFRLDNIRAVRVPDAEKDAPVEDDPFSEDAAASEPPTRRRRRRKQNGP